MGPDVHELKRLQTEAGSVHHDRLAAIELRQRLADHVQRLVSEQAVVGSEIQRSKLRRRAFAAYKEFKR